MYMVFNVFFIYFGVFYVLPEYVNNPTTLLAGLRICHLHPLLKSNPSTPQKRGFLVLDPRISREILNLHPWRV